MDWCCTSESAGSAILTALTPGMTVAECDTAVIAANNVIPPPPSLARPTSAHASFVGLRDWYVSICEEYGSCSGRRRGREDCND